MGFLLVLTFVFSRISLFFPSDITGEENEVVELELKGVKLYIKRGKKPFSDGMHGHLKLLSDKTTLGERLRECSPRLVCWIY